MSAFMIAAIWGQVDTCGELLKNGAQVEAVDHSGVTVLRWAARNGWTECVKLLLQHDAPV